MPFAARYIGRCMAVPAVVRRMPVQNAIARERPSAPLAVLISASSSRLSQVGSENSGSAHMLGSTQIWRLDENLGGEAHVQIRDMETDDVCPSHLTALRILRSVVPTTSNIWC